MDDYQRHQRGRRHGRVCPCCGDPGTKAAQNRAARARFVAQLRRELATERADPAPG